MKITSVELSNIRGFESLPRTSLSQSISVFVGANNSGKSTILKSILLIQENNAITSNDRTSGRESAFIELGLEGTHLEAIPAKAANQKIRFDFPNGARTLMNALTNQPVAAISNTEPRFPVNLIFPYKPKRNVVEYSEIINYQTADGTNGNLQFIVAKIDRLGDRNHPSHNAFVQSSIGILNLDISTAPSQNGKQAGYYVDQNNFISISSMGDGVPQVLGLVADLCLAEDRIFIIEEPENDIHPSSLKSLLDLIILRSATNQFFISTHSNIVVRYLGAQPDTDIFSITSKREDPQSRLFTSTLKEIKTPEERLQVLEEMGYELFDSGLWKGWLFLEESSAQMIIEYLIKWFIPDLQNKLKIFSCNGLDNVGKKFENFHNLITYVHLSSEDSIYKNKAWVILDADGIDSSESTVINKLGEKYNEDNGWSSDRFEQLSKHDFEEFYPLEFPEYLQITEILTITNKTEKRKRKIALTKILRSWIEENELTAKEAFEKSCEEVIVKLKKISEELN